MYLFKVRYYDRDIDIYNVLRYIKMYLFKNCIYLR